MRTAALLLFASLVGCAPGEDLDPQEAAQTEDELRVCRTTPENATRVALERASEGLLFTSESDYPFDYVSFASAPALRGTLTTAQFLRALGQPAATVVEVRSLDRMFSHLVNPDVTGPDAPRYAALRRTIQQRLAYVQVFAVGTIQVQLYVVGRDRCGSLVGLHTVSIET